MLVCVIFVLQRDMLFVALLQVYAPYFTTTKKKALKFFLGGRVMPEVCGSSPGQGLNLSHGNDPSLCSDNAVSLTRCAAREIIPVVSFLKMG